MRFAIVVTAVLAAGLAYGQKAADPKTRPSEDQSQLEADVIRVKTLTGDSFDRLVKLLSVFGAHVQADQQMRTIVVFAPKDVVAQMHKVVAELDTPGSEAAIGRNIEMTMTFLRCSTKTPATIIALPDDIEPVAKQLRLATQYRDIRVWDVVPLRLQEGKQTSEEMQMPLVEGPSGTMKTDLNIQIYPDWATRKDQNWSVGFRSINITFVDRDAQDRPQRHSLTTSGDFLEGQKTVLGKVSDTDDAAIFVVISLKVLD